MLKLPRSRVRSVGLLLLALFWIVAGLNHFRDPAFYLRIMPPWLPAHEALVAWSGVAEVAGGIAVVIPRLRVLAGWGLIVLLVAIYPANVEMALHPERFPDIPTWALYARLPFQFVFAIWAWWATRPDEATR